MKKLTIVLPTYNESGNIEKLINDIFAEQKNIANWELTILVVDSKSPDKTGEIVKKLQKKYHQLYLLEIEKAGLGKAYSEGFQYAFDHLNPYLMMEMDADISHDPRDIPKFVHGIEKGADLVIGSRYIKGGSIPKDWGLHRKIFSIFANLFIRFGFMKLTITDWTSGYRAIKSWVIKNLINHVKKYSGYLFQIAVIDEVLKTGGHVTEVPIKFKERKFGKSKISFIQYISGIVIYILTNSSFIKFVIVGLIGFVIDFGISYLLIEKLRFTVWVATLISAETAIVANFVFNNFWSFAHKKIEHSFKSYSGSFIKFNVVSSGSLIIQSVGIQLLVNFLGRKLWYLYKVLIIAFIIIPYSYVLYNKFIWKEKK